MEPQFGVESITALDIIMRIRFPKSFLLAIKGNRHALDLLLSANPLSILEHRTRFSLNGTSAEHTDSACFETEYSVDHIRR